MNRSYSKDTIRQLFLHLLPVQIFSFVTSSLSGIVNGLVIGANLPSIDMVALGYATPFMSVILVVSTVIAGGARIVCGRFMGRGQNDKVQTTFSTSLFILLTVGIALTILSYTLSYNIAYILGASADAIEKTSLYVKGISLGLIPSIISPCLMTFLQMENDSKYALASTIVLGVVNFVLAVVYVQFRTIDIFKIAVITSISQYITMIFLLFRFITVKTLPRLSIKTDMSIGKEIIIIGLPSALAQGLYAIRNSILNKIAFNIGGDNAVNALSIMNASCGPLDAFNIGIGATQAMLASVYIGEKDREAIKQLSRTSIFYGVILAGCKMLVIALFVEKLGLLYGASGEVLSLTTALYNAYGLAMPLNIITVVVLNTYQALGRVTYCNILFFITCIVVPIGFSLLANPIIGIHAVWNCYWVAEVVIILIVLAVAVFYNKKPVTGIGALLYVEKDIDIEESMTISIKNIDEVTMVAMEIESFCTLNNIDKKRSMLSGLCAEEISSNIIEHGFPKSKKKDKVIDIYVGVSNDEVHIRIKDNAIAFDPHIKLKDNDDVTSNVGIRMVSKLAKEMNYQNTFDLNILTIAL